MLPIHHHHPTSADFMQRTKFFFFFFFGFFDHFFFLPSRDRFLSLIITPLFQIVISLIPSHRFHPLLSPHLTSSSLQTRDPRINTPSLRDRFLRVQRSSTFVKQSSRPHHFTPHSSHPHTRSLTHPHTHTHTHTHPHTRTSTHCRSDLSACDRGDLFIPKHINNG